MTSDGDRLNCLYDFSSPTVSMINAKLHINGTIYDAHSGACYLVIDISNFYLRTNMPCHQYQYLHAHPSKIPQEIWDEYNIDIASDGFVYYEIYKGMYVFKESGVLDFNKLVKTPCHTQLHYGGTRHTRPPPPYVNTKLE